MADELYVWFDMETNGQPLSHGLHINHPERNNPRRGTEPWPLEVAFKITDSNLNLVYDPKNEYAVGIYESTIHVPKIHLPYIIQEAPEVVRQMHYDNGLWDDVRNTPANHTVWDLDGRMEAEIGHVAHSWDFWHQKNGEFNDPQFILCGSGVSHFDSRHIKYHFPRFWQCLKGYDHETKPTIDVGVVRRFTNAFIPPVGERFTKPAESIKHRAMDDVNQIIQEAERMKTVLSDMFTAYDDVQATYEHGKSYYAGKEIEHNPDGML